MREVCYLALGSNIAPRKKYLEFALSSIGQISNLQACSAIYETKPKYIVEQDKFLNMVVRIATMYSPENLLAQCKAIEQTIGRVKTFRNGPRVIDIDVILYGNEEYSTKDLLIPHPRMHERGFVLVPLCEIIDNKNLPRYQKSAHMLLGELASVEQDNVQVWSGNIS
ncbi:MAG: 2-amino-4-hydroxy-6-hydroxymethyldihydropteridine diphosphokinase [Pseudomonadota bacterium]